MRCTVFRSAEPFCLPLSRKVTLPMLAALLLGTGIASPAARMNCRAAELRRQRVDQMFVFGDSYSDIGAGYVDGNGPTAVFYFAARLGLRLRIPGMQSSPLDSLDFAISGAQSGWDQGRRIKRSLLERGLLTQVDDLRAASSSGSVRISPGSVAFIAIGLNDRQLQTEKTKANIEQAVANLHALGLRRFRIATLPEATISFAANSRRLNPAIRSSVSELKTRFVDSDIQLSNWGGFFDRVKLHGARYGILEANLPCAPGRALFDQPENPCRSPALYYFYHPDHPSTAAHSVVGRMLWEEWRKSMKRCARRQPIDQLRPRF
jgi:phospholipase/lecithinase/hemolysin